MDKLTEFISGASGRTLNYHFILSGNVNPFSFASLSPRASAMLTARLTYASLFATAVQSCQAPLPVSTRRSLGSRRGSDIYPEGGDLSDSARRAGYVI